LDFERDLALNYFICALGKINLGIPAQHTDHIIQTARAQDAVYEKENQEVFISLPALLRQKNCPAPHGIVLKSAAGAAPTDNLPPGCGAPPAFVAPSAKTTLLTPRIDAELEIPEEKIHSLPKAMNGAYRFFRGAYCTDRNVILILDPEKLVENAL
jgi:hypothetical protein